LGDFGSGAALGAGAIGAAGAAIPQVGSAAAQVASQQPVLQQLLLPQHDLRQRSNSLQRFLPQQLTLRPQHESQAGAHFGSQQALLPQQAF
jgi:hypothetical protein